MKKAEIWTISISIIALLLSIISILLSSPLLIDLYKKPIINISGTVDRINSDSVQVFYQIDNSGKSDAENIYIKIHCIEHDTVTFTFTGIDTHELKKVETKNIDNVFKMDERVYVVHNLPINNPILVTITTNKNMYYIAKKYIGNRQAVISNSFRIPDIANVISAKCKINYDRRRIKQSNKDGDPLVFRKYK